MEPFGVILEPLVSVNLSIKAVPESIAERLRARAERNHRSLQGELMAIIERAAAEEPWAEERAGTPQPRIRFERRGWKTIEQIAAERLARPLDAGRDLPRAVDIVREARDRRGTR